MLQSSIAERLSVQPDFSGSGTEDEEGEKLTVRPEYDPRQNTLVEIMNTEKLHSKTMGIINAIFKVVNNRPKICTQHSKRAQELTTSLLSLQNDYVTRLEKKLKNLLDAKTTIADVFQCVRTRQEQLLQYQVLSQTLIDYCEGLQEKGQLCLKDFANVVPNRKNISNRSQNSTDNTKYWFRNNLQAPFPWISQTIENIKLLMTLTPSGNPDEVELKQLFINLTNSLHLTRPVCMIGEENLNKRRRQLKVHSLIVELETLQSNERKLRYLLLFSDVLVCAKIRMSRREKRFPGLGHRVNLGEANLSNTSSGNTSSGKQRTMDRFPMTARGGLSGSATEVQQIPKPIEDQQYARLETKWIIPLEQLVVGANLQVSEDQQKIAERLERISEMKEKVRKIRYELKKAELRRSSTTRLSRTVPHLTKIEAELVLQTPQLILPVGDNQGRMRYILLVTEREREQWRTAIEAQKSHLQIILKDPEIRAEKSSFGAPLTTAVDKTSDALGRAQPYVSGSRVEPSNAELNEVLKLYSQDLQLFRLNKTGIALVRRSLGVTGILQVTVHKVDGLGQVDSYHVRIEVDSYGQYEEVARTRVVTQQANPEWNQSFDLHVDDAHQICFTIYRHCDFLGCVELQLQRNDLTYTNEVRLIETSDSDSQPISITFSMAFKGNPHLTKNNSIPQNEGVFGRALSSLIQSDRKLRSKQKLSHKTDAMVGGCAGLSAREHFVPRIVTACVDEIERRGLREVGVYRICGANSDIQTLTTLFNQDQEEAIQRLPTVGIPVIASVLKQFFRELPEPLLTDEGSVALMKAVENPAEEARNKLLFDTLSHLPAINAETFVFLATHLITVARYKDINMMDLGNLALIWSTVLFQSASESLRRCAGRSTSSDAETSSYVDFLNREAAVGFHQTKTLAILLTAAQSGKLSWPQFVSDTVIN
ncbi:hypothetical protein FBUS_05069 [Fasciolopsis buskii]|uniref:Active breakpoint cluster region-related protein n=1 Tax=Fasciolopsis buskii TaxID=27845 RepID=A0A8E0RSB6_9TREM|nr:hypothetical protein FBUS_05069 [Fasciolopsis buski]